MRAWTTTQLRAFLEDHDLCGPAAQLWQQGMNGEDFHATSKDELQTDLRLSGFSAKKLLALRH
eukprot:5039117-Karenia_brevis.AAC.1